MSTERVYLRDLEEKDRTPSCYFITYEYRNGMKERIWLKRYDLTIFETSFASLRQLIQFSKNNNDAIKEAFRYEH